MDKEASEALIALESRYGRFRVQDGQLYGPKGLADDEREIVKRYKAEFIELISTCCRQCYAPLVITEFETYIQHECSVTPLHYCGWCRRDPIVPMDLFADDPKRHCVECGWQGITFGGLCRVCLGVFPIYDEVLEMKDHR